MVLGSPEDRGRRLIRRDRVVLALVLAGLGLAVAAALGVFVAGRSDEVRVDRLLERIVNAVVPMDGGVAGFLGERVSSLGSPKATVVFMILLAVLAYLRRGPRALALVCIGPPIAMITTSTILKPIIGRTRGDSLAYPSGHTTSAAAMATVLAVLVLSSSLAAPRRRAIAVGLLVVVTAVAVTLVGRDYHYATDTVGAVGLAVAVVLLAAVVIDAMADSMADEPLPAPVHDQPTRPFHHPAPPR